MVHLGKAISGVFIVLVGLPLLWIFLSFFLLPLIGLPMFEDLKKGTYFGRVRHAFSKLHPRFSLA